MLGYLNERNIVQNAAISLNASKEIGKFIQNNGEILIVTNKSKYQQHNVHRYFYEGHFEGYSRNLLFSIDMAKKGQVRNPDQKDEYGFSIGKYQVDKRIYFIWKNMERRCYYPDCSYYSDYGGKGITVSESFKNYANFENWYKEHDIGIPNLEIDKDVKSIGRSKVYSPETCILIPSAINTFISTLGKMKGIEERRNLNCITYCVHYRRKYKKVNKNFKVLKEAQKFKRNLDINYLELLLTQYNLADEIKQALRTYVKICEL